MRYLSLFILFALVGTGCSRLPEPVGYDYSVQQKMQAAYHWEVLASDVANRINKELIRNDFISTPVFVKETCGDEKEPCKPLQTTAFNESFRDLLITKLVNLGIPTASDPGNGALTINYKAQLVYHATDRIRTIKPGNISTLALGIAVLRHAPPDLFFLGLAGAADLANASYVQSSHYEVVITTSIIEKDQFIFRQSDIYYINDQDFWHYFQDNTEAEAIAVTDVHSLSPEEQGSNAISMTDSHESDTQASSPVPETVTEPLQDKSKTDI